MQIGFSAGRIVSGVWFQIKNQHLESTDFYSKLLIFCYYFLFQKQSCKRNQPSNIQRRLISVDTVYFFSLNLTREDTNDNILPFSTGNRNLFFSFKTRKINPVTMILHVYITTSYLSAGRLLQIRSLTDFWCL